MCVESGGRLGAGMSIHDVEALLQTLQEVQQGKTKWSGRITKAFNIFTKEPA